MSTPQDYAHGNRTHDLSLDIDGKINHFAITLSYN